MKKPREKQLAAGYSCLRTRRTISEIASLRRWPQATRGAAVGTIHTQLEIVIFGDPSTRFVVGKV